MDQRLDAGASGSITETFASSETSTPPAAPMEMPTQALYKPVERKRALQPGSLETTLARVFVFGGAAALTVFSTDQMIQAVTVGDITVLQAILVGMFSVTFAWIALSTTSALAGLIFPSGREPSEKKPGKAGLCALVMPVYNESPASTTGSLIAIAEDLARIGETAGFEIFILSDTTDPEIWPLETAAVTRLKQRVAEHLPVWYRHRHRNTDRKSGNVQDFVTTWGARYETMLVLDADSLMTAETICAMRDRMAADDSLGLLQTVPTLIGGTSLFARLQQFAGRVYGPVVSRGLAAWQGDDGNYWGHNAIIRTKAFAESCGLPRLPGPPPFGGTILSHDFVEAGFLRRAGWKVRLASDLEGSWEESPPSLLDSAARDRRWAQGNLQHLGVLGARGLTWPSRAHFAMGVMSYLSSPLWFALILVGIGLTVQADLFRPKYFTEAFQLFPTWPRFDSERMIWLFVGTITALLIPKIIGLFRALLSSDYIRRPGDVRRLIAGWISEVFVSALFAPIMMLIQSRHVWDILLGRDAGWNLQRRDDGSVPLGEAFGRHFGHTVLGVILVAAVLPLSVPVLAWLSPVLVGWVMSIPLSWASGSSAIGMAFANLGLLDTPEEIEVPELVTAAVRERLDVEQHLAGVSIERLLNDKDRADRHFLMAGAHWVQTRGQPDVEYLTMTTKLADASSRTEALGWLGRAERMRLLGDRAAFQKLVALPVS